MTSVACGRACALPASLHTLHLVRYTEAQRVERSAQNLVLICIMDLVCALRFALCASEAFTPESC